MLSGTSAGGSSGPVMVGVSWSAAAWSGSSLFRNVVVGGERVEVSVVFGVRIVLVVVFGVFAPGGGAGVLPGRELVVVERDSGAGVALVTVGRFFVSGLVAVFAGVVFRVGLPRAKAIAVSECVRFVSGGLRS